MYITHSRTIRFTAFLFGAARSLPLVNLSYLFITRARAGARSVRDDIRRHRFSSLRAALRSELPVESDVEIEVGDDSRPRRRRALAAIFFADDEP